jgi:hypothetical protein
MALFHNAGREKWTAMAKAMDAVNDKFGGHSITFASTISGKRIMRLSPRLGVHPE